jgi:hypothetical protein
MPSTTNRKDKTFIAIIALVHVIFFILACGYKRIYNGDSFEYIYEGLNIKDLFFFYSGSPVLPITPEYMTQRPPLYPLFLWCVYLFTVNNWTVIVLQNLLSIFTISFVRKIFKSIGYQTRYDRLLVLFIIAYPAQFINANTIAPDILLQFFAVLYFGNFISFFQKKQLRYPLYMSLALIAGMLVKPVLYPFVTVHIIIVFTTALYLKLKMQRPVLIALAPLCAVLLYNYWNFTRTGTFHFTSNQSFNAFYYYYPYISSKQGADSANRFLAHERKEYEDIPDYDERYQYANRRGEALLKQNFLPYMLFHLKNSARIFIEPGKAEIDLFTGKLTYGRLYSKQQTGFRATWQNKGWGGMNTYIHNNPSLLIAILILLFNIARLIGLLWFFTDRHIHWLIRSFSFIFIIYFALAAGPIANTRYFLPVSLIVICCSVLGFTGRMNNKTSYSSQDAVKNTY